MKDRSGVYAVVGSNTAVVADKEEDDDGSVASGWALIDVGESGQVGKCVKNHERRKTWHSKGFLVVGYLVFYADRDLRKAMADYIRAHGSPMCGEQTGNNDDNDPDRPALRLIK